MAIPKIFAKIGTEESLDGSKPFLLDEKESLWMISSGNVDVFLVRTKNGAPCGPRIHLFRAEPGNALFGLDFNAYQQDFGLLAVAGTDTSIHKLKKERIKELIGNSDQISEIADMLNSWINGISSSIVHSVPPKSFAQLTPEQEILLEESSAAKPEKDVVWIKALEGDLQYMDMETERLKSTDSLFPVSNLTWLHSKEKSRLRVIDTKSFLKEDPSWLGFDRFHEAAINSMILNVELSEKKERERLKAKDQNDRAFMQTSLSRLSSLLNIGKAKAVESEVDDHLFQACYHAGNALGIPMEPHPDMKKGIKLPDPLRSIVETSRVRVRNVILKGEWWKTDIGGPLLAYLDEDKRPVAILPVSSNRYTIYDPSDKSEKDLTPEIALLLYGVAQTFYRPFPEKALSGLDLIKFGLHGLRGDLTMISLMGIVTGILSMIVPMAIGEIFDNIIPQAERGQLIQLGLALVIFAFATTIFQITRAVAILRVEGKMNASIQAAVWDRSLNLPVPFFRDFSAGDLAQRAMGINAIRQALSGATIQAGLILMTSLFNFALLFYYSTDLAFVVLGLVLLSIILSATLSYLRIRHQKKIAKLQGKISGMVLQFITGINKIRVAGAESRIFSLWSKEFTEQRQASFKAESLGNYLVVYNVSFPLITSMVVFYALVYLNQLALAEGLKPALSVGQFLAFNAASTTFIMAMLGMTEAAMSTLNIIPYYERSKPIFQTLPEVDVAKSDPGHLMGNIEVDHLFFRYTEDGPLILQDVSLNMKCGEYIALVGASGSGKSTLFRLLLGFETPSSGTIYYDGQDLAGLNVRSIRRQLGVVLQNGRIMAGEIYQNIVGSLPLTIDDAWEAAKMAGFDQDIKDMPMGMHTYLGEGGGTLSGGQRQRLIIARAIVHKPRIIYFDEATSALDNKTQATVSQSLDNLKVTRVVIAHRLSTIINADRIFVMDKGKIVQSGNYEELIKQEGLFAELAKRQIA